MLGNSGHHAAGCKWGDMMEKDKRGTFMGSHQATRTDCDHFQAEGHYTRHVFEMQIEL